MDLLPLRGDEKNFTDREPVLHGPPVRVQARVNVQFYKTL